MRPSVSWYNPITIILNKIQILPPNQFKKSPILSLRSLNVSNLPIFFPFLNSPAKHFNHVIWRSCFIIPCRVFQNLVCIPNSDYIRFVHSASNWASLKNFVHHGFFSPNLSMRFNSINFVVFLFFTTAFITHSAFLKCCAVNFLVVS